MVYNTITNDDFTLVENDGSSDFAEFYGVKLTTGKYKGIIVIYGKVSVSEIEETGEGKLSFTYAVQDPGDFDLDFLQKDEDFNNYLGDVLTFFIEDSLANKEAKIGNIKSTTDAHTESPAQ